MSRRRFYVPRNSVQDGVASLPPDQAHHLRDVLRMGSGEVVEIFDGDGNGYIGEVDVRDSSVRIRGLQRLSSEETRVRLLLAAALIKSSKFEWILQKATELGVHEIIPLKTRLSEIEIPSGKIALRLERWDRIVRESSKQCRRLAAPRVHAPRSFPDFLSIKDLSTCPKFLFYEKAAEIWHPDPGLMSGRVVLCIGPEGGWNEGEIEMAKQSGCKIFSLGPWVLRAETAAIAAVSILQHQIYLLNLKSSEA
jgi:16S rRNA (uracil1498-N3)-methyltransferase